MTLRTLLVDDEPPALRRLERLLSTFADVEIVGRASSVAEAKALSQELDFSLVFLDIQMPGELGFGFLSSCRDAAVIFTTAYSEFAVRAFEVQAVDYLLKPLSEERLAQALSRARQALAGSEQASASSQESANANASTSHYSVSLPLTSGTRFVDAVDIVCILARDDYSEVVLQDGTTELVGVTMKAWEKRLPRFMFARVHRGAIVALSKVSSLSRSDGRWLLGLRGYDEEVRVSRDSVKELRSLLETSEVTDPNAT